MLIICSGGQTGADRGGLDAAIELDTPHRGWCPKGRRAEDGRIPDRYLLQECQDSGYQHRTRLNVLDAGMAVIFTYGTVEGGSLFTQKACIDYQRAWAWFSVEPGFREDAVVSQLFRRIALESIYSLNVAGSRESRAPGIQEVVCRIVKQVVLRVRQVR